MRTTGSFSLRGRPATPGREAKIPGTQDNFVGRDGHISAWNRKDAMRVISSLLNESRAGRVDVSDRTAVTAEAHREKVRKSREVLLAAYNDRTGANWSKLGANISGQITESADREGFMRRLLIRNDLQQGNYPRIRIKKKKVTAVVMTTESQIQPQFVRDDYLFPPEFTISANIRVEQREINQGSGDILEDKYNEGLESVMVAEDRRWKQLADATVGLEHQLKYLAGGLNPTAFAEMRTELNRYAITPMHVVMSADYWNDIIGNSQFSGWFDPLTKYEIVTTGELGQMLGLTFITDGFRQENLRVLEQGDLYLVGDPQMHGGYTDRGPVQSNPVDQYADGSPARGWFMFEELSMVIANPRSVIKAKRT